MSAKHTQGRPGGRGRQAGRQGISGASVHSLEWAPQRLSRRVPISKGEQNNGCDTNLKIPPFSPNAAAVPPLFWRQEGGRSVLLAPPSLPSFLPHR